MQMIIEVNALEDLPSADKELLVSCKGKKVFAFYGPMGVGKTTFVKALCKTLGVTDVVTSPTFSLVNEYHTADGKKIFHFDFYRIESEGEAYDMGYEDYFYSNSTCFIEWPEKVPSIIPSGFVKVNISQKKGKRFIAFEM